MNLKNQYLSQILPGKFDNLVVIAYKVKTYCHSFSLILPSRSISKNQQTEKTAKREIGGNRNAQRR